MPSELRNFSRMFIIVSVIYFRLEILFSRSGCQNYEELVILFPSIVCYIKVLSSLLSARSRGKMKVENYLPNLGTGKVDGKFVVPCWLLL